MLPLTIWMNMPSFHQGDLFRALAATGEVDLRVIFAKGLPQDRLDIGWQNDLSGYSHQFLEPRNRIGHALRMAWSHRDRIHIFNGLWAERPFAAALAVVALARGTYAIYSEIPEQLKYEGSDPSTSTGWAAREIIKRLFGRLFAPRAAGILPVSNRAAQFFKRLGVSEAFVYPFGYFRSKPLSTVSSASSLHRDGTEVVFVGRLSPAKGLDLLLDAIQPLFDEHPHLFLSIVGAGECFERLQSEVKARKLTPRVTFEGVISPDAIPSRLVSADILVLPSRGDGWGLVVNEALSVGVPVIVSDRCGAGDLIRHGVNGYVFPSGDIEGLRASLRNFLDSGNTRTAMKFAARISGQAISAEAAAPYLVSCLKHMIGESDVRPTPPWLLTPLSQGPSH